MYNTNQLIKTVATVYDWIDSENSGSTKSCRACGRCCDFKSYDHRLFVTAPELIYFNSKLPGSDIKPIVAGICPYNIDGKCTVYDYRFAGCRIFSCKGDKDLQSQLTESALEKLKSICRNFNIPYQYTDLKTAYNMMGNTKNRRET